MGGWKVCYYSASLYPTMADRRLRASTLAIATVVIMMAVKLGAGIVTMSIGMISQAVDSATDLLASLVAFYAVRKSTEPPDELHPYGHSKVENLVSVIVGMIIIFAAVLVAREAATRLLNGEDVRTIGLGIGVMAIAVVVNLAVSTYLYRTARQERSIALEANAANLRVDVLSNLGVLIGLVLVYLTGLTFIDPIVAIIMAVYITISGLRLIRKASSDLLDENVLPEEERIVREVLGEHSSGYKSFHAMKARRGGADTYLEMHLAVESNTRVEDAHALAEHLAEEIRKRLPHYQVNIHLEPAPRR